MKLRTIALGAAAAAMLTACVDDGYGGGVSVGYRSVGYYSDFYDGAYGTPYYGWYRGYYYPGSGYYVYDRDRRPVRWTEGQRHYWNRRGQGWRGSSRGEEWRGFDRGPGSHGSDGYRSRGRR